MVGGGPAARPDFFVVEFIYSFIYMFGSLFICVAELVGWYPAVYAI